MFRQQLIPYLLQLPLAHKAALCCALCTLLATGILIAASLQGDHQLIQRSSELFGQSLAEQLARDASHPLVQGDKLSLQALLNKLVQSPLIVKATIYDVENQPIVEAGPQLAEGRALSASISFQDSLAGYAVLVHDASPLQQQARELVWQLFVLGLLLAALSYLLALLASRPISAALKDLQVIADTPEQQRKTNTHIAYPGQDELQVLARSMLKIPEESTEPRTTEQPGHALLAIRLLNFPTVDAQRPAEQVSDWLNQLQQRLQLLCTLYDAQMLIARNDAVYLDFQAGEDDDNYPFRALCSAMLLIAWERQQASALELGFGLEIIDSTDYENRNPNLDLHQQLQKQQQLERAISLASTADHVSLHTAAVGHASINKRLENLASEPKQGVHCINLDNLGAPYRELLVSQLAALMAQANTEQA